MADLASRVRIDMAAVVTCIHDVPKRAVTDLVYDAMREQVATCPCCENAFASEPGDPIITCHTCRPRRAA